MLKKLFKIFTIIVGGSLGYAVSILANNTIPELKGFYIYSSMFFIVSFAIIFYLLSDIIIDKTYKTVDKIEYDLRKYSSRDILLATAGLVIGLTMAFLLSQLFSKFDFPILTVILSVIVYVILPYLGALIAIRRKDFIWLGDGKFRQTKGTKKQDGSAKVLDTSVIIDGRISDIINTGFVEGTLIIPQFVLDELQHVADSADALKRQRGRRGLDILKKIQNESRIEIFVDDDRLEDIKETDAKLLKLASMYNGKVITNDYNLNKVAAVQGIEVLNINELANAVKPVVLPTEVMNVEIVREGKEKNQGLAYLTDGTMIVVENGSKRIGETLPVEVTTVLQTAAGKMIFARIK